MNRPHDHRRSPRNHASDSRGEATFRMVKNSAFNLIGMALIVPLNFVALFTLARRLGKESLGIFFTLFAISAVIYLVTSSGATTVLMRRIAQNRERMSQIVGQAAGILVVVCGLSVVAFLTTAEVWGVWTDQSLGWRVLCAASVAMVARHCLEFSVAAVRGAERFEFENVARVVQSALYCGLILTWVTPDAQGALWAFIAYASSNVIAVFGLIFVLVTRFACREFHLSRGALRDWYAEALPLGAGDVIRRVGWQLETLMLAALQSPAAVGIYSVAYRPLQPLQILPRSLVSVTFPSMSRQAQHDRTALKELVGSATGLLFLLSLPLAISVTICARPLILATAGDGYESATLPLQLLIWLTSFTFVNTQLRFVFSAIQWEKTYWAITAGVLVAKLLGGLICIPLWGVYGACLTNVLGEGLLTCWGMYVLQQKDVTLIPWGRMAKTGVAALGMGLLLAPLTSMALSLWTSILACTLVSLVYLVGCVLLGALPQQQLRAVADALGTMASRFGGWNREKPSAPQNDVVPKHDISDAQVAETIS